MGRKHPEIVKKPKNQDMEELDTLRKGTKLGKLKHALTETWGKRAADAEAEDKKAKLGPTPKSKSNTLGAPKTRMKRSPSLVLRAMSQRYLETAKSETEFKRRKSEFSIRRKAAIRTLDEDKKQKATQIIEANMVYKAAAGKEGMLSEYIQACDPAHLQDLIDRGFIEAQAENENGEIDVSKIESNEFNLNNNEFMGRLGREQFEDKVHEIVDFVAANKQIQILSLTNACVDTYFGIQVARMMMETDHITELNLESNDIYEQGIELMAEVLKQNKSLKILKLTNQKRYPGHATKSALITALESNRDIIRFSYDFMNIQQNDLKDRYLNRNQKWSRNKNRMAPSKSPTMVSRRRRTVIERVSTAKQNSELDLALQRYSNSICQNHTKFDLSQMGASFRRLTDLQMIEAIGTIESILTGNQFIERVIFKNSNVKDNLARAIAKCLATTTKVRELNLEANDLSSDFLIELTGMLKDNATLQVLNIRHQRKDPSRAVAAALVKYLEHNRAILKIGFKFTQTHQAHLKERYLKRNATAWRVQRAAKKAEDGERQRMLDDQEAEHAGLRQERGEDGEHVPVAKDGELQPTLGGLARLQEVDINVNLSPFTSPMISPLSSPMARDRRGRPLSWGGNMELDLDKLHPKSPRAGQGSPDASPSPSASVGDSSQTSNASEPSQITETKETIDSSKESETNDSAPAGADKQDTNDKEQQVFVQTALVQADKQDANDEEHQAFGRTTRTQTDKQDTSDEEQQPFVQISVDFSAAVDDDDEEDAGAETPLAGDAPAAMDSDDDQPFVQTTPTQADKQDTNDEEQQPFVQISVDFSAAVDDDDEKDVSVETLLAGDAPPTMDGDDDESFVQMTPAQADTQDTNDEEPHSLVQAIPAQADNQDTNDEEQLSFVQISVDFSAAVDDDDDDENAGDEIPLAGNAPATMGSDDDK